MILNGTKILTEKGLKYVSDLRKGDRVLSHKARWDSVVEIKKHTLEWYEDEPKMVQMIGITGEIDNYFMTPNHMVYCRSPEGNLHWMQVKDVPRLHWFVTPRIKAKKTGSKLTPDMTWALGVYCAKGVWVHNTNRMLITLKASVGQDMVKKFCKSVGSLGAERVDAGFNQELGCFQVKVYGDVFKEVVMNLFHEDNETVPTKICHSLFDWPQHLQMQFASGFLASFPDQISPTGQVWEIPSEQLAYQLQLLFASAGVATYWDPHLWDFRGVLTTELEAIMDDTFWYRELWITREQKKSSPVIGYSIRTQNDLSMCIGTVIVSSTGEENGIS